MGSAMSRASLDFAGRLAVAGTVVMIAMLASLVVWLIKGSQDADARLRADLTEIRGMWTGAELVRICAGGERVYRLSGRLVTGAYGWSQPLQFAADVTPEAACVR